MYIPKRYGESRLDTCPFCGRQATTMNKQKIPVCVVHKESVLEDLKCACGSYLDTKVGKFGVYFSCIKCGNVTMKRALELNPPKGARNLEQGGSFSSQPGQPKPDDGSRTARPASFASPAQSSSSTHPTPSREKQKPKEIIIRSDDPNYFD